MAERDETQLANAMLKGEISDGDTVRFFYDAARGIRWEKKGENYLGMLHLACALITYRASGLLG